MTTSELHKDLQNSIVKLNSGLQMVHHFLYVGTYTGHPFLNQMINDSYNYKKEKFKVKTHKVDL